MKKLNKIYHIADIHIRNLKRHKEYSLVFNRLYDYLKSVRDDDSIILLAGDIVHAKTDMTPEVVDMTQNFLRSLSDIMPTILIPGNHDANLNNPSRLDALSPIVQALNHPNLHYYKNTTIFEFGGVTFVHKSVFDGSEGFIPSSDVDGEFKIGLFHGPVDGIQTEHGFKIDNKKVTVESFNGYDLVLLGDIHVPNNSVGGVHTIKYPGSLISQNHSESIYPEHGILVWDIQTKKSVFIPVKNNYGFITINVINNEWIEPDNIPKKPYVRLFLKNTENEFSENVKNELEKK